MYRTIPDNEFKNQELLALVKGVANEVAGRVNCPVVCAGGSIRDARWNWNCKDIDIFLLTDNEDELERASGSWDIEPANGAGSENTPQGSFKVLNCNLPDIHEPVQLIMRPSNPTIEDLIDGFDYSLVKQYYNPATDECVSHTSATTEYQKGELTLPTKDTYYRWRSCVFQNRGNENFRKFKEILPFIKEEKKKSKDGWFSVSKTAAVYPDPLFINPWRIQAVEAIRNMRVDANNE